MVGHNHHHWSTDHSRETPDDALSKSQFQSWSVLDHEGSLFAVEATERFEEPTGADGFIRGAEWPE